MRVHLCGVRGSAPSPGVAFARHGGNTSCVALAHDGEAPSLVLDAGSGLRNVSGLLGGPFRGTIVLGHLHIDHHLGLPFFTAGDRDDAQVRLLIPEQGDPLEVLGRAFAPPHFPITLSDLRGQWSFGSIDAGAHCIEGFEVLALDIPHKGGRTFGFRISDGGATIAYLSDHHPTGGSVVHEASLALARDVDLLIHDAQYTAEEFATRRDFGHCTIDHALELADAARVGRLLLFHHDPERTDEQLDALVAGLPSTTFAVGAASETQVVDLAVSRPTPVSG